MWLNGMGIFEIWGQTVDNYLLIYNNGRYSLRPTCIHNVNIFYWYNLVTLYSMKKNNKISFS